MYFAICPKDVAFILTSSNDFLRKLVSQVMKANSTWKLFSGNWAHWIIRKIVDPSVFLIVSWLLIEYSVSRQEIRLWLGIAISDTFVVVRVHKFNHKPVRNVAANPPGTSDSGCMSKYFHPGLSENGVMLLSHCDPGSAPPVADRAIGCAYNDIK